MRTIAIKPVLIGFVFITGLLAACQPQRTSSGDEPTPFFDLLAYIDAEAEALNEQQPKVRKRVVVQGQEETQVLSEVDFSEELKVFRRSDINRKAWIDKYQADSTFEQGQLVQARYVAIDSSLKTRWLEVQYNEEGEVQAVLIRNRSKSPVVNVRQDLSYRPGKGYRLVTAQSTALSREQEVVVEVEQL